MQLASRMRDLDVRISTSAAYVSKVGMPAILYLCVCPIEQLLSEVFDSVAGGGPWLFDAPWRWWRRELEQRTR